MDCILHIDEIFLKGNNQPFFFRALIKNLKEIFPRARARRLEGGVGMENLNVSDLDILNKVPGVANFASAFRVDNGEENIKDAIARFPWPKNVSAFRISGNRSFKQYPLSSAQLENLTGKFVQEKFGWPVDLKNFSLQIHVDVGKDSALIYGNLLMGAGGLPAGTTGKVLCLLSGGIDSPVAAYAMMKRGAEIGLIHFQNETKVSAEVGQKIMDLAKTLARYHPHIKLFMAPFEEIQRQVVMKVPAAYRMIVTRRLMFKIAEKIANREKYLALVTGDSLGQVASQTLENLRAIYSATDMLKLAPLMGANKTEIIALARSLGTLEISNRPYEDCCSLFVAKHPEIRARLEMVERYEKELDWGVIDKIEAISYNIGRD